MALATIASFFLFSVPVQVFAAATAVSGEPWEESGGVVSPVPGGGRTKDMGDGFRIPINTLIVSSDAEFPSEEGVSLETAENAWRKLASATGFNAYVLYDSSKIINASISKDAQGDYIVKIGRGLLEILRTEDEIAGVLAHEIGHGVRGHHEKAAMRNTGIGLAVRILSSLFGKGSLGEIATNMGGNLAARGYSREQEVEADDFSPEALKKAGYSPWGLYEAILRMSKAKAVTLPSGFSSHPPNDRRMKRLVEKAEFWSQQPDATP